MGIVRRQRQEGRDDDEEGVGGDDRPLQRTDDACVPSQPFPACGESRADRTSRPTGGDRRVRVDHGAGFGRDARRSSVTIDTQYTARRMSGSSAGRAR